MKFPVIDMIKTGQNISRLRKERKIKVMALQEIFGFNSPTAIYKWESGEHLPCIDNLLALAVIFGVPLESIIATK